MGFGEHESFSDGTVVSPAERWKRSIGPSIIDDWLSELKFATSKARFDPDLSPEEIKEKKKELKPGARIVSYGFTFEGWQPKKADALANIYGPIYLYKIS